MCKIFHPFAIIFISALLLPATAGTALAGFQWTPPSPSVLPPGPSSPVEKEKLDPVPVRTMPSVKTGAMRTPQRPMPGSVIRTLPPLKPSQNNAQKPKWGGGINPYPLGNQATAKGESEQHYEDIVGFGSDMPMALALRQIVPPEYSFSFANGVNPGYRVSWEGGRPWNEVVRDMVAPLKLSALIKGNTVQIIQNGSNMSAVQRSPEPSKSSGSDIVPSQPRIMKTERSVSKEGNVSVEHRQSANQPRIWEANRGDSLKNILGAWTKQANIELVWDASHDYTIESNVMINGTFGSAIKVLFAHALNPGEAPGHDFVKKEPDSEVASSLVISEKS